MYQSYNYYPQQQPVQSSYQRMTSTLLKGRPVASLEEARAMTIDFDGSVFYFPDLANKRIYTKQINVDGTASLNMYELKEIPVDQPINTSSFVTREEFESALAQLQSAFIQATPHSSTQSEDATKQAVAQF